MARVDIEAPSEEYLKTILCYPRFDEKLFSERLSELERLGISELYSKGPVNLSRWRILGKGHAGVVIAAGLHGIEVAVKILRTDADRPSLEKEGELLAYANTQQVGPLLVGCSKSFMVSELITGVPIRKWLETQTEIQTIRRFIRELIFQAYRLDLAEIDHGELSRPEKHVFSRQDGTPVILDFESAGIGRRCNNLPSVIQYLFIRRRDSRLNNSSIGALNQRKRLILALKRYKTNKSIYVYREILRLLDLD